VVLGLTAKPIELVYLGLIIDELSCILSAEKKVYNLKQL